MAQGAPLEPSAPLPASRAARTEATPSRAPTASDAAFGAQELLRASWDAEPRKRPRFEAVLEILNAFHLAEFKCTLEEMIKKGGAAGGGAEGGCCAVS